MPKYTKEAKKLKKYISRFGLTLDVEGSHYAIRNEKGNRVGTMSVSSKSPAQYNMHNTLKQLVQNDALPESVLDDINAIKSKPKNKNKETQMSPLAKARAWLPENEYVEIGTFKNKHGDIFLIYSEIGHHRRMFVTGDLMGWGHKYEYLRELDAIVEIFDATRDEVMEAGRTVATYWRMRKEQKLQRDKEVQFSERLDNQA